MVLWFWVTFGWPRYFKIWFMVFCSGFYTIFHLIIHGNKSVETQKSEPCHVQTKRWKFLSFAFFHSRDDRVRCLPFCFLLTKNDFFYCPSQHLFFSLSLSYTFSLPFPMLSPSLSLSPVSLSSDLSIRRAVGGGDQDLTFFPFIFFHAFSYFLLLERVASHHFFAAHSGFFMEKWVFVSLWMNRKWVKVVFSTCSAFNLNIHGSWFSES